MSSRIASATAFNFGLIAKQVNASNKFVSLVKQTGVIHGGFPYNAFNGAAKVRPEAMTSLVEMVRATIFNPTSSNKNPFIDAGKIYEDYLMFINASTMEVDEKMYDHNICKGPLLFDVELDHIGKTSSQIKTSFFAEGISKPLFVSRVSTVLVCNKTRVPKPPPEWWAEKYKNAVEDSGKTNSFGHLEFNSGDNSQSSQSQFRIFPSDCDSYRHTNWSHYIRYCHDAFGLHMISKHGNSGFDEYFRRGVRCFSIRYQKESSIGDVITVKTSPEKSQESDNIFYFKIENEAKDVLCQSKIEYYPPL